MSNEKIEGTPFHITTHSEKGKFLRMGDHRFSEYYITDKEVYNYLEECKWEVILKLIICINEIQKKFDTTI